MQSATRQEVIEAVKINTTKIEAAPDSPRKAALLEAIPQVIKRLEAMSDAQFNATNIAYHMRADMVLTNPKFLSTIGKPIAEAINTTK